MKVLKLCTSDEFTSDVPDEQRAYRVAERVIADAAGEPVETILKPIWPRAELPAIIERWMMEHQPDLVLFVVSPFWMTFESVPLKLQRRFGRAGKAVGNLGTRTTRIPWLVTLRPYQFARRMAIRTIGGAYHFEPEYIADLTERCARVILREEKAGLVIRGPLVALGRHGSSGTRRRAGLRRLETHRRLKEIASRLHAGYVGAEAEPYDERSLDAVHSTAVAHRQRGMMEGQALAEAWKALHPSVDAR